MIFWTHYSTLSRLSLRISHAHIFFLVFLFCFLRVEGSVGRVLHTFFILTDLSMQVFTNSSPPLHCNSPFQAASHGLEHQWCVGNNDLEKKTYRTYQQIANVCMITIFEGRKKRHKIYSSAVRKKSYLYTILKVNLKRYSMKK